VIKKSSLYCLLFTIFNDAIGWGIVLTIFAPLVMDPSAGFLGAGVSLQTRNLILGFLISSYAFTQFLFMPFIGAISDHWGRKRILKWTIGGAGVAFVLSALSIWIGSLWALFFSRLLAGIFSANSATAQAAISDVSSERDKSKNLSLTGVVGGFSWILGSPLGGLLSSSEWIKWGDFATPFWFVAGLFFLNLILV
jgi:DHA1 family tetracycline resistance protein-like MFS transporter